MNAQQESNVNNERIEAAAILQVSEVLNESPIAPNLSEDDVEDDVGDENMEDAVNEEVFQVGPPPDNRPATLTSNLRTLHAIWTEYEFGIAGNRPAKLFSRKERGACRHMYAKRKLVWDKVILLIRAGHLWEQACDLIYQAYGQNLSPTAIFRKIQLDNKLPLAQRQLVI